MKPSKPAITLVAILFPVIICLLVFNNARRNKSTRKTNIEGAKKYFTEHSIAYDSLYASGDTVRAYNKRAFVGMTVTTTE